MRGPAIKRIQVEAHVRAGLQPPRARQPHPLRPRLGQSQALLRTASLTLVLCFLWCFGTAPLALAAQPAPARPKRIVTPMTAAELAQRVVLAQKMTVQNLTRGQHLTQGRKKYSLPTLADMIRHDELHRQNMARHPLPSPIFPAPVSLLDDVGRLAKPVSRAQVADWKTELKSSPVAARRAATLHLWLGEYALAQNEDPHLASWHWRVTQKLVKPAGSVAQAAKAGTLDPLYGLAAYNTAVATFDEGAYSDAAEAFLSLDTPKTGLPGYDRRSCALWLRHAAACAGYHDERARMGIPEPPRLDPLCGVAALATCLKPLGLPYDKQTILKHCRVTGEGNNLGDLVAAGPKLGVTVRTLTATDEGLREMPKPLISYIEHDHFVAVVRADNKGVGYLCSDCGAWPGGQVNLTWKQWHALEPGVYASANRPGSYWDQVLAAKETGQGGVQLAASLPASGLLAGRASHVAAYLPKMPALHGVKVRWFSVQFYDCVSKIFTLRCNECQVCCAWDFLVCFLGGPCQGDPVNLSTGEEEYRPAADLTVYNPNGPSVSWQRVYDSLGSQNGLSGNTDYGDGWSQSYNVGVSGNSIVFDNGSNITFTVPTAPTAGSPRVSCPVMPGTPLLVESDYSPNGNYYTITFHNRTRWVTNPSGKLSQIVDRNGNAINFNYSPTSGSATSGLLISITDKFGASLLTITRAGTGTIAAISDRYNRSVYYHVAGFGSYNRNENDLDYVSQIVPACSPNPPAHYIYGYQSIGYPGADYKRANFLHTISAPNPVGDGSLSTATINYDPGTQFVSSLVDANNNQHTYQSVNSDGAANSIGSYTLVQEINGKTSNVDYSYTVGYDSHMSQVSRTDGAGRLTSYKNYSDPNDPYRPSAVTDGNASQSDHNQHIAPGTTATLQADQHFTPPSGSRWAVVSPSGSVVATDASPGSWAVSELTQSIVGSPVKLSISVPASAPQGNGYNVCYQDEGWHSILFDVGAVTAGFGTTTYTWDAFHNVTSMTSPRGTATTNTYDYSTFPLGELTKTQEGAKTATQYAYDHADGYTDGTGVFVPCGLPTAVASPKPGSVSGSGTRVTTTFAYDLSGRGQQPMGSLGLGNLISVTAPGNNATVVAGVDQGITTTFAYTGDGTNVTSPSLGLPLSVTDNLGKTTHLRYDAQGQTTSTIDALGNETDTGYNENGGTVSLGNQVQGVTLSATGQTGSGHGSSTVTYLYPGGPALASTVFDEGGYAVRQVNTAYGKEGETLAVSGSTEPVTYTYDGLYRQATLTDGGGHTTSYFYNVQGYLAQVVYPGAQSTPPAAPVTAGTADTVSFTGYDADGNPLSRVDGRGVITTYAHADAESRLTGISYAYPNGYTGGTAGSVSLGYDGYGRHSAMSDGTGGQTYTYDDADDLTQKTVTWTGLAAKTVSYGFYPNGSRSGMTADGQAFSYGYDKVGRMTGLTNPSGEPTAWAYRDNGWLQAKSLGNASSATVATTTYTQNALGQVTDLLNQSGTGTTLSEFGGMAYDGTGNRTTMTASLTGAPTNYSGTTGYTYDYGQTASPTLNRSQLTKEISTRGGYTNVFSYDGGTSTGAGNPAGFKGATNTFNADNQLTNAGYGYDGAGNPTTYQTKALAFDPENRMTQYGSSATPTQTDGYSGDWLRAWKSGASGLTYFLYDGTQPVCEYSVTGTPAVAVLAATNTFGKGGLVSRHTSDGSTFYAFDERGNVAQRVSSIGAVLSSDLYDGYGARSSTGAADVWGFEAQAGYRTDAETGLLLCTHRFYGPGTGRWLTRDPIGYNGGVNLYGYVGNDPIHWNDPSGYFLDFGFGPIGFSPTFILPVSWRLFRLAVTALIVCSHNITDPPGDDLPPSQQPSQQQLKGPPQSRSGGGGGDGGDGGGGGGTTDLKGIEDGEE